MPIYPYKCNACGEQYEKIQKFSDAAFVTCESCGKDELVRTIGLPAFQLKGTGWYATDFKNSGKPAKATSTDTKTEDSASTSAAPSDDSTKPSASKST